MIIVNEGDLNAKILSPITEDYDDLNNWSVVIKLKYGDNSFLFTGDIEEVVEEQLLSSGFNLKADVLKVAHHGSHSSTYTPFIEAVSPEYAVISAGKDNRYGHPSALVIRRLQDNNISYYRTDLDGTIIATSNGQKIEFNKSVQKAKPIKQDNTSSSIKIINLDLEKEIVVIKNTGNKYVILSGWRLLSVKGN